VELWGIELWGYLFFGLGALVVGFGAALVLATTAERFALLLVAGAAVVAFGWWVVLAALGYFEPDDPAECTDCGEGQFFAGFAVTTNATGWAIGVLLGGLARRLKRPHHGVQVPRRRQ
jgi:hypothetical protein